MKKRNLFMATTLMCSFLIVAFKFDNNGIHWLWADQKEVPFILGMLTIILGVCWVYFARKSAST